MSKTRVGVLRGGPSSEYDVSLKTGGAILRALPETYQPLDILIDKDGKWHIHGLPKSPTKILHQADVIINALHGNYGEDGTVQKILESHHVPFTGPKSLGASLAMNKALSKKVYETQGLQTPVSFLVRAHDHNPSTVFEIFSSIPHPAIVKPVSEGSSYGIRIVHDPLELRHALGELLTVSDQVLVEEYIEGREASCGVVENFRRQDLHALMPVEIRHDRPFFDYDAKYSGAAQEICPSNFSDTEKKIIEDMARAAHQALGLRHYSRSDFIVHPRRGVFILETNALPGLTDGSLFPLALQAGGTSMKKFVEHLIAQAIDKR